MDSHSSTTNPSNRCSTKAAILYAILFGQFLLLLSYTPLVNRNPDENALRSLQLQVSDNHPSDTDPILRRIWKIGFLRSIFANDRLWNNQSDYNASSGTQMTSMTSSTRPPPTDPPGPDPKCGYLARMPPAGRLGSQMFAYATFYGIARKQRERGVNKTVFIRIWEHPHYLKPVFEQLSVEHRVVSKKWFERRNFLLISEPQGCCRYDSRVADDLKCDGQNIYVDGYRLSYKYFAGYIEDIRKEYTFQKWIKDKSYQLFADTLSKLGVTNDSCTTIGVHLRRGDFATVHKASYGHMAAQSGYFQRAVEYYERQIFGNSKPTQKSSCLAFLVFGNDYDWNLNVTRQVKVENPRQTHFGVINFNHSEPAVDMHTVGLCDHAIISTGTYSWWSAFFNRGMVTYQKEYARPNSGHYGEYEPKDYFLPHWIAL